jgi:peptide deformylase
MIPILPSPFSGTSQVRPIVTDIDFLRKVSQPVKNFTEGRKIGHLLVETAKRYNSKARKKGKKDLAIGLAAPQIGILKQVCLIYIDEIPMVLMNPQIVEHSPHQVEWEESCLSLPGVQVKTRRWPWVKVQSLNLGEKVFGWTEKDTSFSSLLKSIVCQHEIDHLCGKLINEYGSV